METKEKQRIIEKETQRACQRRENTGNGNFLAQNLNLSRDLFKKEKDYCSSSGS